MRRPYSLSAFGECIGQALVRFGVLQPPAAQKGAQIFGKALASFNWHDPRNGLAGPDQYGRLTPSADPLYQIRQTSCGIFDRNDPFLQVVYSTVLPVSRRGDLPPRPNYLYFRRT